MFARTYSSGKITKTSFRSVQHNRSYIPNGHLLSDRQVAPTHYWSSNGHIIVISLRSALLLTARDLVHVTSSRSSRLLTARNLTHGRSILRDVALTHVHSIFAITALVIVLASIVAIILDGYIFLYPSQKDMISDGYFPLYPLHKDFIPDGYFPLYPSSPDSNISSTQAARPTISTRQAIYGAKAQYAKDADTSHRPM